MIPAWNSLGILPPIAPGAPGHSGERSPYTVSMHQVIDTFSFTERRKAILRGLLRYREALYQTGISRGFQWIDGSFIEDVETLERRDPNDLDVVTFFHLPQGMDQRELLQKHGDLFKLEQLKKKYQVDGYTCLLGEPMESRHVQQVSYWYSMWSHRRDRSWKGFLQVGLSKSEDELASKTLDLIGLA